MNDKHLVEYLTRMDCREDSVPMIAARRIEELKLELARTNQRLGLYMHHASRRKEKVDT
jgi:hypothetical protein